MDNEIRADQKGSKYLYFIYVALPSELMDSNIFWMNKKHDAKLLGQFDKYGKVYLNIR